jgi:hypothetical protein
MTFFADLNAWAIVLAAAASFIFGGVWYGVLSKQWMQAAGLREDRLARAKDVSPKPFVIALIAQFVMAGILDSLLLLLADAGTPANAASGAVAGFLAWLGFIMVALVVNHQFQKQPVALTAIDGGHWLGVTLIQGGILGAMGFA